MKGITKPYVYVGGPMTSFGIHIEDGNLASINYLHEGATKVWIIVPGAEGKKLESIIHENTFELCVQYIRHKTTIVSPSMLKENVIKFAKVRKLYFCIVRKLYFCIVL